MWRKGKSTECASQRHTAEGASQRHTAIAPAELAQQRYNTKPWGNTSYHALAGSERGRQFVLCPREAAKRQPASGLSVRAYCRREALADKCVA